LIDGDGYLFSDELVRDGENGAIAAGHRLCEDVRKVMRKQNPNLPSDIDVLVRVYVNKKGLANALVQAKVLETVEQLDTFFVKLTQYQPFFDVVDCGSGKERVDEKIRGDMPLLKSKRIRANAVVLELYRHYVNNPLCRHITVGCCHDSGYVSFFEKYQKDKKAEKKTSLLIAGPPARGFGALPFTLLQFLGLFRTEPLKKGRARSSSVKAPSDLPAKLPTSPKRTPKTVSKQAPPEAPDGKSEPPVGHDVILLNKHNERVDPKSNAEPSVEAQKRFDALNKKFCNDFQLGGSCHNPQRCRFDHGPMSAEEKCVLEARLRGKPCSRGPTCRKRLCYYGHHCPLPKCVDRSHCQFKGMHEIDQKAARCLLPDTSA
jgi:hypothetical protein